MSEEEVIYEQKTQLQHIIDKPDMYIGSIVNDTCKKYIYNNENNNFINKEFLYNPGLYKIIDEAISNASDHSIENVGCNIIKIDVNINPFRIRVWNNSDKGIPIRKQRSIENDEMIYIPELIFGHLLTSSNYNKNKSRITNGTNGLGIKLTNIYSTKFRIECSDGKKIYKQIFSNSMQEKTKPTIQISPNNEKYICISFIPNLEMFNFEINNDFLMLIKKMVYDIAFVCNTKKKCSVYYNDELININNFDDYINLYHLSGSKFMRINLSKDINVGFAYNPDNEEIKSISFINNHYVEGGTHIEFILKQIFNELKKTIKDEIIKENMQLSYITDNCCIYMNCYINDPSYNSQCKFSLTNKFKTKKDINEETNTIDSPISSDSENLLSNNKEVNVCINKTQFNTFINNIIKNTGLLDKLNELSMSKLKRKSKKTDGKRTTQRIAIDKLEPAKFQGVPGKNTKCFLMITEGDSAKLFAMRGRNVIGSDYFGVFPIRGKMLNTRNATNEKILDNEEITKIKQIIGLETGKIYTNEYINKNDKTKKSINDLNYGGIIILTDQDLDGYHIKGLVMNFIESQWPELIKLGFCKSMNTPIKIASPKTGENKNGERDLKILKIN